MLFDAGNVLICMLKTIDMENVTYLQKLGKRIRQLRQQQGLNLRELAVKCHMDNSKVSKIEHGKINVTMVTLFSIAEALHVPAGQLLDCEIDIALPPGGSTPLSAI